MMKRAWGLLWLVMVVCVLMLAACDPTGQSTSKNDTCRHTFGEWSTTKEASCKEAGTRVRVCSLCGEQKSESIAKTNDHAEVIDQAIAATCETDGLTEGKHCSVCDTVLVAQKKIAAAHIGGAWTTDKEPTCTEPGSKYQSCTVCSEPCATRGIPATGHTGGAWTTDKEPTCTEAGSKYQSCTVCLEPCATEVIDATGHTPGQWKQMQTSTCKVRGFSQQACVDCGDVLDEAYQLFAEHSYTSGACSVCGAPSSSEGLAYALNSDSTAYTVVGIGQCQDTALVIGNYYDGLPITAIAERAFVYNETLTSVIIGDNIQTIGKSAFASCEQLKEVTFGKSITNTGESTFSRCAALQTISWGEADMTVIGKRSFEYCTSLAEIDIPEGVLTVDQEAFQYSSKVKVVKISTTVTSLGTMAFYNLPLLEKIYFNATECRNLDAYSYTFSYGGESGDGITLFVGANVKAIPQSLIYASSNTPKLVCVEFAQGSVCKSIGDRAFRECDRLQAITLPLGLETIGERAFQDCVSLKDVTLPDSVTTISKEAFLGCDAILQLTLPASVTQIGKNAFANCSMLIEIYNKSGLSIAVGSSDNGQIAYYAKNVYTPSYGASKLLTEDGYVFYVDSSKGEFYLVNYVGNSTALTLPASVSGQSYRIHPKAFLGQRGIVSIIISEGVLEIGDKAFYTCTGLESVSIGNSVSVIGENAFYGCTSLKELTVGTGVVTIRNRAFFRCVDLETIRFNAAACGNLAQDNEVFYEAGASADGISVIFGNGVTAIPSYLFKPANYSGHEAHVASVTFEQGSICKTIGQSAFGGCSALKTVEIPDSIESIETGAFTGCEALQGVYISDIDAWCGISFASNPLKAAKTLYVDGVAVTEITITAAAISDNAFQGCTSLTKVTLSANVQSIGTYAFLGCTLTDIHFDGTMEQWGQVSLGYAWVSAASAVVCTDGVVEL